MSQDERPGERLYILLTGCDSAFLLWCAAKGVHMDTLSQNDRALLDHLARAFLRSYGVEVP